MKTCATCRFMAAPRRDYDGFAVPSFYSDETGEVESAYRATCVRIVHGNARVNNLDEWKAREATPAVVVDGSGYAARLLVLPTFGCVLHEENE